MSEQSTTPSPETPESAQERSSQESIKAQVQTATEQSNPVKTPTPESSSEVTDVDFEEAPAPPPLKFSAIGTFDFGLAIQQMQKGSKVSRAGWNGKGMWIAIQNPDANSKMTLPYIYMKTADNQLVPWLASQTDILAADWVSVS